MYNEIMKGSLTDIFIKLSITDKRKLIELVKNRFEVDSDKKVKITFKSAFRKLICR